MSQDTRNMCDVDAKENSRRKCSCQGHKLGQLSSKHRAAFLKPRLLVWQNELRSWNCAFLKLSQNSYLFFTHTHIYIYTFTSNLQIRGGVETFKHTHIYIYIHIHIVFINVFNVQIQGGVGITPKPYMKSMK